MPKKSRFQVLSPDGLPIAPCTYPTLPKALKALTTWCKRFEAQGYYSTPGERIPLDELADRCIIGPG